MPRTKSQPGRITPPSADGWSGIWTGIWTGLWSGLGRIFAAWDSATAEDSSYTNPPRVHSRQADRQRSSARGTPEEEEWARVAEDDWAAIAGDWAVVGNDLGRAAERVADEGRAGRKDHSPAGDKPKGAPGGEAEHP